MNILFLSRWFPFPHDNGSKIRVYHLLTGLSRIHNIALFSFVEPSVVRSEYLKSNNICSERQVVPGKPFDFANSVLSLLQDKYLQEKLTSNGQQLVEEKYDWQVALSDLDKLYDRVTQSS